MLRAFAEQLRISDEVPSPIDGLLAKTGNISCQTYVRDWAHRNARSQALDHLNVLNMNLLSLLAAVMAARMERNMSLQAPDYCTEFYVIEKVIEIVAQSGGEAKTFRIEALREPTGEKPYSTRAYVQDYITVQPAYPQIHGEHQRASETLAVWSSIDIGWTSRGTADEALQQALGFLGERCRN